MKTLMISALLCLLAAPPHLQDEQGDPALAPFTVEYSYKIKWGHVGEWMDLYKKNHWPFIHEALESGDMLSAVVHRPRNHVGEADRWDLRVTITYKDILVAHGMDDFDFEAEMLRLGFDPETFEAEERRRFELLEAHLDTELEEVDTAGWR